MDRRGGLSAVIAWVLVLVFVAVGFRSIVPPRPLDVDASGTEFSAARAREHVEVLSREPHPMGSTAIARVRNYLVAELRLLGLEPRLQAASVPDYFGRGGLVDVVNVSATIPGTHSTGAVVLVAHYDTVPTTSGANDNSAAVASLLEAGRALLEGASVRNDVILLFTDGEEPAPRYGASLFVADSLDSSDVAFVVNFEAVGGSGPSMLVETNGPQSWIVGEYAAAVSDPTAFSFVGEMVSVIGEVGTDFDAFRAADVPGLHLAYTRGSSIYHTAADDLDSVSWGSVQHHGSQALDLARHLGDLDLAAEHVDRESVYFTVRPFVIAYPASWSPVPVGMAIAALVVGAMRARRMTALSGRSVARSGGVALLTTLAATLCATLGWILLTAIRSTPSVVESYVYLLGLAALAAVIGNAVEQAVMRNRPTDGCGFVVLWAAFALLTAVLAPGVSYLFAWPVLVAALLCSWDAKGSWVSALIRFALVAATTLVLMTPAVDFFFQFGQPRPGNLDSSVPAVAGVAIFLMALVGGLLRSVYTPATIWHGAPESGLREAPSIQRISLPTRL